MSVTPAAYLRGVAAQMKSTNAVRTSQRCASLSCSRALQQPALGRKTSTRNLVLTTVVVAAFEDETAALETEEAADVATVAAAAVAGDDDGSIDCWGGDDDYDDCRRTDLAIRRLVSVCPMRGPRFRRGT